MNQQKHLLILKQQTVLLSLCWQQMHLWIADSCERIAKRSGIGLGRTGSHFSNGSGDIVIAFSTANPKMHVSEDNVETSFLLREDGEIMNDLFLAATEVTEEAILNSMSQAVTTTGRLGNTVHAYPF